MNAKVDPALLRESYDHSDIRWGSEIEFPSTRSLRQLAHRIYNRYPARSISLVPRSILLSLTRAKGERPLRVLDPFMGSGTTAVEAQALGLFPVGVELDPFARLVATVRTTALTKTSRPKLVKTFDRIARRWAKEKPDEQLSPRLSGIDYWFGRKQFNDL